MRTNLLAIHSLLAMTIVSPSLLSAQFKAPNSEELKMTAEPKAPGAAAVYLDIEDSSDDDLHSRTMYVRIKVLKEQGKELARVVIPSQGDPSTHRDFATVQLPYQSTSMLISSPSQVTGTGLLVTDFKARTIHSDGSVVPLEGKLESLLKVETTPQHTLQTVVYLPGVEVGSVVEYRYVERYDGFYSPPLWNVQRDYFVRKAHFAFLPYKTFQSGTANQAGSYLIDQHGVQLGFLLYWPKLPPGAELKREGSGRFYLDVTDVPAVPQEEWGPAKNSLLYRVRFYYNSESNARDFWAAETKRWSKEVDQFAEPTKSIHDAVASLTASADSDLIKAKKLYKAVQALDNTDFSRQKADSTKLVAKGEKRAEETWTQKSGSSQDIAILYLALLRAAGITANAIRVVDRDHGVFTQDYLYFNQLDGDILSANIGGKEVLLDPGEKLCPFGMLHWKHMGVGGVREGIAGGVAESPLQPYTANTVTRVGDITLDNQGGINGVLRFAMMGQQALFWRQATLKDDSDEVKKQFDQWLGTIVPGGVEAHFDHFLGVDDPEVSLVAVVKVQGSLGSVSGNKLVLPAFFLEAHGLHPFVDEANRAEAVDMQYGEQVSDQIVIHLPSDRTLEGTPQEAKIPWEGHAVLATKVKAEPGEITITRSLARAFAFSKPEEYSSLREFYQKVAAADQQQLTLVQTSPAATN